MYNLLNSVEKPTFIFVKRYFPLIKGYHILLCLVWNSLISFSIKLKVLILGREKNGIFLRKE